MKQKNLQSFLMMLLASQILSFGLTYQAKAQTSIKDSLQKLLKTNLTDKKRVDTYNLLAKQYQRADSLKVTQFSTKAISLAQQINYPEGICDAYYQLGYNCMVRGYFKNARQFYEKIIPLAKQVTYHKGLHQAYIGLGIHLNFQGKFPQGMEYFKKALKIAQKANDLSLIANAHTTLGITHYRLGNTTKALKHYQKALNIHQKLGNKRGVGQNYNNMALIYERQGKYAKALANYQKVLQIFKTLKEAASTGSVLNNLGNIYRIQNSYSAAIKHYQESLKIWQKVGDHRNVALVYTDIGLTYQVQDLFPQAIDYHLKALKISEKIGEKSGMARSYYNIGAIHYRQKDYTLSRKYYLKSLRMFTKTGQKASLIKVYRGIATTYDKGNKHSRDSAEVYFKQALKTTLEVDDREFLGKIHEDLGIFYRNQQKYALSLTHLQKAIAIHKKQKQAHYLAHAQVSLGNTYYQLKEYPKAKNLLVTGTQLAKKIGATSTASLGYETLALTHQKLGDYEKAYNSHLLFKTMSDSLFNQQNTRRIAQLEARYRFQAEKDSISIVNQREKALLRAEKERHTLLNYLLLAGIMAFLIIGVLIIRQHRLRLRKNQLIQSQKEALYQANLEKEQIQQTHLRKELELKNQSLMSQALHIQQKNKFLEEVKSALPEFTKESKEEVIPQLKKIKHIIHRGLQSDKDWKKFQHYFEETYPQFYQELTKQFTNLSPADFRISALLRLNLNTQEIADILGISYRSANMARYRLRKKLALDTDDNLISFLMQFG
ncbi:transcriptional regulator [uncultured Microscilla sp.]|uniref:tetratricopeptide repeat protein n=1 Tax=uncultured Microscilla sp. TaxID=432653 RepID=UPI00260E4CC0|nr:transcriptional regulator [uncultured Microscilla sp.]